MSQSNGTHSKSFYANQSQSRMQWNSLENVNKVNEGNLNNQMLRSIEADKRKVGN